jgi:hypothetical protein
LALSSEADAREHDNQDASAGSSHVNTPRDGFDILALGEAQVWGPAQRLRPYLMLDTAIREVLVNASGLMLGYAL